MNKKETISIITLVLIGCIIMAFIDGVISPPYYVKSLIKIVLFLVLPFIYCILDKQVSFKSLFSFNKKGFLFSLGLGISVYIFILGSYFILSPYFDLSNIKSSLQNNIGVNKGNFVFVALYISFINSLLEEFFFRGFAFLSLKKVSTKRFAYIFSSSAFALYHVAFMINWFTPLLFILLVAGLFISGMLFNWLNDKNENIYTSWLVHMCANFSINTIGFILFGIIL